MTVITLTSVGYGEVHPLSKEGQAFTIVLLLVGLGVLLYVVTTGITFLVEGQLGGVLKRRKMEKQIATLKKHYIICAAGEMGTDVIEEFYKMRHKFVVVSNDNTTVLSWVKHRERILYIDDDPADDEVLIRAGIDKAKGLVSALGEDPENLFVVLSARQLNPKLRIVSQVVDRSSIPKLRKAGADEVVSAMEIGGMRIASSMIRPAVVNFLDQMLYVEDRILRMEERIIPRDSSLVGRELGECRIPQHTGMLVIAVKDAKKGRYFYNPSGRYKLSADDVLIVLGDVSQLESLSKFIG
jgi:voltage-gated potassium channel